MTKTEKVNNLNNYIKPYFHVGIPIDVYPEQ